jgi:hypothetical protein
VILKEATIGGTVYLDYLDSEMALPESERVAFDYGAISNKIRGVLIHKSTGESGIPLGADVCREAIDGTGNKIRNLTAADGTPLDSVAKLQSYHDKDLAIAYMLEVVGMQIWRRQAGEEVERKN